MHPRPWQTSTDPQTSTIGSIVEVLRSGLRSRRVRQEKLFDLARDIWAVALGLRLACLVDVLLLDEHEAEALGASLEQDLRLRRRCMVLHDRSSSQTFVCSRNRLDNDANPSAFLAGRRFVDVSGQTPILVSDPPDEVASTSSSLASALHPNAPPCISVELNSPEASPTSLVAIAGMLLEYPIVYVSKDNSGRNALARRALHIIVAHLAKESSDRHLLASFSVPEELCSPSSVQLSQIVENLQGLLSARLTSANEALAAASMEIVWTDVEVKLDKTVTLDRVAL